MSTFPRLLVTAALLAAVVRAEPTVSVEVRDGETGRPVKGALVAVAGSDIIATTDGAGRCLVVGRVGRGSKLTASGRGFFDDTLVMAVPLRRDTILAMSLHPNKPRWVRGTITDATTRSPLPEVLVTVAGSALADSTGASGSFLLAGFPHGPKLVRADLDGFAADSQIVTARGGETTEVSLALRDTTNVGELAGEVIDAGSGRPVAGARVRLEASGLEAQSDSSGHYAIGRLSAGLYDLSVSCPGFRKGYTRFRVLRGWTVEVNLRLHPVR